MEMNFGALNWLAILACVIVGQGFLTVWFLVVFGDPWAKAYGVADKAQHTKEVPGYTYGIGAVCVLLLSLGLAILQQNLGIETLFDGLMLGAFVGVMFCVATAMPGYAFLKRWNAFFLAIGAQISLILILSAVLVIL